MRARDLAEKRDFYEVLGVSSGATQDEIRAAYKKLARDHHPDRHRGEAKQPAEERFKEISEAYAVLSDPERRQRYDRFGHGGIDGGDGGFGGMSPFDLFDLVFGTGREAHRRHGPEPGADLRTDLELTLEESATGVERTITLHRYETCSRCQGSGARPESHPETCSTCRGSGQVRTTQNTFLGSFSTVTTCQRCGGRGQIIRDPCVQCAGAGAERKRAEVTVRVPAGIDDGQRIVVRGQGEAGPAGGPPGDLYAFIHVRPHRVFERHGRDLVCEVSCSFARAALGGEIEVPTLDGPQKLSLAPGTQPGDLFRVRGRGMPVPNRPGRGDLLVVVRVRTPENLNERQRRALEELAEASGEKVSAAPASAPKDAKQEPGGLFEWVRNVFSGKPAEE